MLKKLFCCWSKGAESITEFNCFRLAVRGGATMRSFRWWYPKPSPEVEHRERMVLWVGSRPNCLHILFFNKWRDSMHAKGDRNDDVDNVTHVHSNSKLKKAVDIKPCIQIKFELYRSLSYDKIFKTRSHLPIFCTIFWKLIFFNSRLLISATENKYFNNTNK